MTLALTRAAAVYPAAPAPARRTLLDVLADTAPRTPTPPRSTTAGTALTYRGLADEVEAHAPRLTEAGIGVGDRVGIRVASGTADLYVAILAVLAAGAAYVPVDADDPDERAELVFGEAGVCAVLGAGGRLTAARAAPIGTPARARPPRRRLDHLHLRLDRHAEGRRGHPPRGGGVRRRRGRGCSSQDEPIGPGDRVLAGLSVAFDASCEEMWLAWRHGACLVPAPRGRWCAAASTSGRGWSAQRITVVSTVPTLAALWPPRRWTTCGC